jgi:hypothetical protein
MTQRLEDTCVPRLLSACYHRRLSGTLTFRQASVVRHVYCEQGAVVYAASEVVTERFGERLCTLGCISPEQLAQAMLETKKGKRLGACLVELGYLSAADLQAMLAGHITYLVHALFPWTTGEYQFYPQRVQVEGFQQSLSPLSLIFDGIRNLPNLDLIRRWLGSPNRILQPVAAEHTSISGVELTPEEAFVLSRLDAPLRVEDICRAVPLPEDKVLRALCALTITGIANFTDADPLPIIESKGTVAAPAKTPVSIDARQAAELCFELEEKLRVIDGGGSHYQVLGVNRRCTPEELKKAYRELAKKFHPDRHSQLAAFDFQVKAELERVFIAVQQAYEVLSDEEKRHKYDLTLNGTWATPGGNRFSTGAYSAVRPTPPNPPGGAPSSGSVPKPPPAPPPRPSFQRPSPPGSATAPPKPSASTAFPTPPTPPVLRPTAGVSSAGASETTTGAMPTTGAHYPTGAYQSVPPSPPKMMGPLPASPPGGMAPPSAPPNMPQRLTGAYPKAPGRAPAKPSPVPASELYLRAVEYMGNGDVERAYQAISQAVDQRPNNADYQALLARVLIRLPGRNKEAEKAFLTAIDLCRDPEETAELFLELSNLYLKFGLESRAIECLDRGLELSPEHEELRKLRQSIGAKQKTMPRSTGSLRVATGRRLQALVGKVFGLDDVLEEGKSTG